jgi:tetratricopeptide (TPR) repeat protein
MPAKRFKFDVFLSHNRAQKDWTREFDLHLRNAGFNVWFDERNLRGGVIASLGMEQGVEESRHAVLVLSPEFLASEWTDFETQIAIVLSPANRDRKIIPILHTKCKLPPRLARISWIDFSDTHGDPMQFEFRLAQLMSDLNSKRYQRPMDFKTFQSSHKNSNPNSIPPVRPLPHGSRMPHRSNPLFVGREAEMLALKKRLTPGSNALVGVHAAVTGMGGVGKTQLAIEYAHHYGQDYPGGVFWLNFAGEEDPINEVARCGGPEGLDLEKWSEMKTPDQASRVQKTWEESDSASLLIFDNAEDPAAVEKWRPKHGLASVLITSRRDEWPPEMGVKALGIETLPRQKSLELLAEVRPLIEKDSAERQSADKICDRLGDLPLALTVATKYLRTYKTENLSEYLHALSAQPAIQDPSLQKVSLAFGVSYNKLKPEDATDALAQKLFHLASWFAPVSINRQLLITSAGVSSMDRTARHTSDEAFARLQELGLIKQEINDRFLLHRLLRDFARLKAPGNMNQIQAVETVGESLDRFATRENNSGLPQPLAQERAHLRELASESEQLNPDLAARLYDSLGFNGRMLALFDEARADNERALKISEAVHGTDHPSVAAYANNLGLVQRALGDLQGALNNFERALKIDEAVYGPDHPLVATLLNNLGLAFKNLGDLTGARANYERALKIDEAVYGPDHPDVAIDISNLGSILRELGDTNGARAHYERALKIGETVHGPDHPNVATRLSNLGSILQELRDLQGARANYERALKIDEAVYGPGHPKVAIRLINLGSVLRALGDLKGARVNFERALKIDEAVYGPDHMEIATDVGNIGSVLHDLGDIKGARTNFKRALKILKNILGDDHPQTKIAQDNLDLLTEKENEQKNAG